MGRRMVMMLVVVMVGGLFVSHAVAQDEGCLAIVNYLVQSGAQAAAAEYAKALDSYMCALEVDPLNAVARVGRLQTALLMGDYLTTYGDAFLLNDGSFLKLDTAIATQTEILAENPDNVSAYQTRAFLYLFSSRPNLAHTDAGKVLKLEPDSAFAYLIQAASSETLGDAEGAADAFATAVELSPDNAQFYGLMAAAQWTSFNLEGMAANSRRAIELTPDLAMALRLHGMSQMALGNPEGALADANRAIELDPSYYAHYILRANAHLALGNRNRLQAAYFDLRTAIDLNPRTRIGHLIRADVLRALDFSDAAAWDFATAVELGTLETVEGAEVFADHTISKYPPTVTRLISVLCIILLLAAFMPSAIRLYVIGSQTFGQAVSSSVWQLVVTREMRTDVWYMAISADEDADLVHSSSENTLALSRNGSGNFPKSIRRLRLRRCVMCGGVLFEPSLLGGRRRVYC